MDIVWLCIDLTIKRVKKLMKFLIERIGIAFVAFLVLCVQTNGATFEFKDGDRVAFIGNTFTERAQQYGYLETLITIANPDKHLTFRNLGWSGDNVHGESRAYFGSREDGFKHLVKYMNEVKPTVIVIAYGSNAAFKGDAGMDEFKQGMQRLVGEAKKTGARLVFVSPTPQENLGKPYPDPAEQNKRLAKYTIAIQEIAEKHDSVFVDLYNYIQNLNTNGNLTYNGIHYGAKGYHAVAPIYAKQLGVTVPAWSLRLTAEGQVKEAVGTSVKQMTKVGEGSLKFAILDTHLHPAPVSLTDLGSEARGIVIEGLPAGRYLLKVAGKEVASGTAEQFAKGEVKFFGPSHEQAENLRKLIVEKNELFFHSYRPQNETYLRGFRKHEQGNNAVEIAQFAPLVKKMESQIAEMKQPKVRQFELVPIK